MVESVHIERVVTRDQVEQFKLVLLCTLPVAYPPSFYRLITKVSAIYHYLLRRRISLNQCDGVCDILVRGSVPLTNGSTDPTLDPTPFFSDFKDANKFFFLIFFSLNLPAGTLSSVLKIKFFAKILC